MAAVLVSSLLFRLGTGLQPCPWFTWLAPLPVLAVALRLSARAAFALAFVAWLGGESQLWGYFLGTLDMPPAVGTSIIIGTALAFGLTVLGTNALLVRRRTLIAACFLPVTWAGFEYLLSLAMPHGAWWSLAYTQADLLLVLQTVSVTGPWGVTFLVLLIPSTAAVLLAPGVVGRAKAITVAVTLLAVALGYGGWHLAHAPGRQEAKVALLAADRPDDPVSLVTPAGRELLDRYLARVRDVATGGVRVVVIPEKVFAADDSSLRVLSEPLARLASQRKIDVVVGLVLTRGGTTYNAAIDFQAGQGTPAVYYKRHLIPGAESDLSPGDQPMLVPGPGGEWALAVCKDMDFPGLIRDYRQRGATGVFVPAWDFGNDGWLHSRIAVTGGVESGVTIARSARRGDLTVSDPTGRVLAEKRSDTATIAAVVTRLPSPAAPTVYSRFGDWFAWACLLVFAAGLASLRIRRAGRRIAEPRPLMVGANPAGARTSRGAEPVGSGKME
ncbi:nitrilase-related carbon-nitrogen hydrolase [Parafrankia discariae]|uniref:nitrilase-related carbon-nitrogen hydrolase n=1 Tax=Parafrankia discariae TaxID=365528 RepID=UPI0012B68813|nr:nitrilase-related carbon-nitrogen hydrolase [Parafrankia discariae]